MAEFFCKITHYSEYRQVNIKKIIFILDYSPVFNTLINVNNKKRRKFCVSTIYYN